MTTTPSDATPNDGKNLAVEIDGARYARIPLRTHVVTAADDIVEVVVQYTDGHLQPGDLLFVTEKIVAISQGRSYPMEDIQPRRLATFLSRYVTKTSFGIGLGIPETMEMALRECGTPRILFAAGVSAVTKVFGRTGDFYRVAGPKARGIDGPTAHTIPPYNHQVVLVPENPRGVALQLQSALPVAVEVAVVDINDLGGNILGSTVSAERERLLVRILKDNPLGQGHEGTPLGIIRAA
ncbi:MAG: coenzyme F420-0:L-glutamate ligase [Cryobacterium sp.]|nr:coenzyme F420-0:L-glutamate ligase [Cryobacterium sp.]